MKYRVRPRAIVIVPLLVIALALLVTWPRGSSCNLTRTKLSLIRFDMTAAEVESILGPPTRVGRSGHLPSVKVLIWNGKVNDDGKTYFREFTVYFDSNGRQLQRSFEELDFWSKLRLQLLELLPSSASPDAPE
jgi:hypothetical protein